MLVDRIALQFTGSDPDELLLQIVQQRDKIESGIQPTSHQTPPPVPEMLSKLFSSRTLQQLQKLADIFALGSRKDQGNAEKLAHAAANAPALDALLQLESVFLKGSGPHAGEPRLGTIPTRTLREKHAGILKSLEQLMHDVAKVRQQRLDRLLHERTAALHDFATAFLAEYDWRKQRQGLLEYDDLTRTARRLLSSPGISEWILYRLDGGLDHILIDEAQDTSPDQWEVIRHLEAEFAWENDRSPEERTLFVVGDEKQSIYSFQGADPEYFGKMRQHFERRRQQVGKRLESCDLRHTFRSAPPILQLTDKIFNSARIFAQAPDAGENKVQHLAFDARKAGRVDLWDFIDQPQPGDELPWHVPKSMPASGDAQEILARQVAGYVATLLGSRSQAPGSARPLAAGDFLILVQRRSALFHALIDGLKSQGVPVAGADRLEVGAELAVRDILSLLKFMVTPGDSLSLAEALRSPLLGLTESELFELAHGRSGRLWDAVREARGRLGETWEILDDCAGSAARLKPFEMIERILVRHGGRTKFLSRLGKEAEDGINELVSQALAYEQTEPPTISGFLNWFELGHVDVKRQMQHDANQVRVMTVHGAKGLEAPVVILPDTSFRRASSGSPIVRLADGRAVWKARQREATKAQLEAEERRREFDQKERLRLLYVAMTRAIRWLIICGAGARSRNIPCWYDLAEEGMTAVGARRAKYGCGIEGLRHSNAECGQKDTSRALEPDSGKTPLPDWLKEAAEPGYPMPMPLAPSGLGGSKFIPGREESGFSAKESVEFGIQVHSLLESLPEFAEAEWPELAKRIAGPQSERALEEASRVLKSCELGELFGENSLSEVPVSAKIPELGGRRITGTIDRLAVSASHVLAVDFKTNASTPETPEEVPAGILRQMGAYSAALEQIYPDKHVDVAILWTRSLSLMPLPQQLVRHQLKMSEVA